MRQKTKLFARGYLILESLIALVVLGVIIASVIPTVNFMLRRTQRSKYDTQASLLLQEGMEVVYNIFATDWNAYGPGSYKIVIDSSGSQPVWSLMHGTENNIAAKFMRKIEILPVNRDASTGDMGGGPPDGNSRMVKTTIQWQENGNPVEISAQLLLTNLNR
jgi:type II secretory pathway pseudopilin PulG